MIIQYICIIKNYFYIFAQKHYSMAYQTKKKINKGLIVLSKGERTSVINLLSLIALLLGFSLFRPAIPMTKAERKTIHNLDSMLAVYEKHVESELPASTATSFEKPSITKSHPRPTSSTKSKSETISSNKTSTPRPATATKKSPQHLSLNNADSTELITLPQIGEVMASRIHRYRDRLGGYVSINQLFEVKGMDTSRFETVKPYLELNPKEIRHLNVNQDEFKTLLRHPYLEYEQVKAIVNHRERKGLIRDWQQLKEITGEVNPLLEQYLTY